MREGTKETVVRDVRVRVFSKQYDCRESLSARLMQAERGADAPSAESIDPRVGFSGDDMLDEAGDGEVDALDVERLIEELYEASESGDPGEPYAVITDGRLRTRGDLCELSYEEAGGEEGIENTRTTLVFSKRHPDVITLTRSGMLKMTLSFEAGRYHVGTYKIGALAALFSNGREGLTLSSYARRVENRLLDDGTLLLDYVIEVRGMDTQRVVFELSISDAVLRPTPVTDAPREDSPADGEAIR